MGKSIGICVIEARAGNLSIVTAPRQKGDRETGKKNDESENDDERDPFFGGPRAKRA